MQLALKYNNEVYVRDNKIGDKIPNIPTISKRWEQKSHSFLKINILNS